MCDYDKWETKCQAVCRFLKTGKGADAKPKLKIRIMDDLRVLWTKIPNTIGTFDQDVVNRGKWPDFDDMYKKANEDILDKDLAAEYLDEHEEKGKGRGRSRSPGRQRHDSPSDTGRSRSRDHHHRKDKKSKDKKRKGKSHHGHKSSDSDSTSVCVVFLAPPHP